jgi:hypothetical protein
MITGQITLSGITDPGLVIILKVKETHPGLGFAPQSMQPTTVGNPARPAYNSVVLSWSNLDGFAAIKEILGQLAELPQEP